MMMSSSSGLEPNTDSHFGYKSLFRTWIPAGGAALLACFWILVLLGGAANLVDAFHVVVNPTTGGDNIQATAAMTAATTKRQGQGHGRQRSFSFFSMSSSLSLSSSSSSSSSLTIAQNQKKDKDKDKDETGLLFPPFKRTKRQVEPRFFERRPEKVLQRDYHAMVQAAHLRHVVVETEEMAQLALETYLQGHLTVADPFGQLARDVSICQSSRHEGGRVGWISNPLHSNKQQEQEPPQQSSLIPPKVVEELFRREPRGGHVLLLESVQTRKWHLISVDDVRVLFHPQTNTTTTLTTTNATTAAAPLALNKVVTPRSKLPGSGVLPQLPLLQWRGARGKEDLAPPQQEQQQQQQLYYHVATTGCQMNVADSERLAGVLETDLGLLPVENPQEAQVVVLHTCSIRQHAEQKLYNALGPFAARKRRGEPLALVVSGCVAQQEGQALLKRVPEIDLVMGSQYIGRLASLLQHVCTWGAQMVATEPTLQSEQEDYSSMGSGGYYMAAAASSTSSTSSSSSTSSLTAAAAAAVRRSSVTAFVPVINGCDERCTFCVVPNSRLVEQSRSMEAILDECRSLAEAGYAEVTLLGQNIDAYGRDLHPRRSFYELLHYLERHLPLEIKRIRYVTSHPRYFSPRVIQAVATLPRVCECFHMPFQSGDDDVLRDMRRGYTQANYLRIIQRIRQVAGDDAAITGDVIVGFPGETPAAFQRTLDLMEAVKFDNLNTFCYSPRPYTEAATWVNDFVPADVSAQRLQVVQELATRHALERSQRYVGRQVEILIEGPNPKAPHSQVMGKTRQGRAVFVPCNPKDDLDHWRGKLMQVVIREARPWSLVGEQVMPLLCTTTKGTTRTTKQEEEE